MDAPGAKVVCGGTTGEIVGRILGRKVFIDLSSVAEGVPPVGMLPRVDLVTEGAVTLVQTLEHLKSNTSLKELKTARDGKTYSGNNTCSLCCTTPEYFYY